MSDATHEHVEALRRAFDESYALPLKEEGLAQVKVLTVMVAGRPVVLRLDALRGVHHRRRIVPVRGGFPEVIGLSGLNGEIVPVYDTAQLLGIGTGSRHWQWWALAKHPEPVGFAFERLEGYAALPETAFTHATDGAEPFVDAYVNGPQGLLRVIDLERLVRSILARPGATAASHLEDPCPVE